MDYSVMVSFSLLFREYQAEAMMNILHSRVTQRLEFPFTTIRFKVFSDLWEYTPYLQSHYP
ncbi:hypothetical protein Tco_1035191, partial [Tanacetum coccineum]